MLTLREEILLDSLRSQLKIHEKMNYKLDWSNVHVPKIIYLIQHEAAMVEIKRQIKELEDKDKSTNTTEVKKLKPHEEIIQLLKEINDKIDRLKSNQNEKTPTEEKKE